ncbi:sugar fermentation stimulation protein A [Salinibacillus kushneri]|uniref:Sugar fermentation stimulation protein homolog n=1 Tax=Salinibacillus kushneri TaxID=237682 RepID=A0A1I0DJV3_9BACI|nr:DNA/RNA nuclease SfsA [Salinibacillus kushneri]SET32760.1 sugar fermentation stimulation protein A [Salinibacillus kushneri]
MFLPNNRKFYPSVFIERKNRFILTCKLADTNEPITVHLQDPGRLKELLIPENLIYVSYHNDPQRKTKWTAELITRPNSDVLISLRSTLPNQLIKLALQEKVLPDFSHLTFKRQEYTFGKSRWDFLLEGEDLPYLLEVKSVTMAQNEIGYFPDAPTKRGKKHVEELIEIRQQGTHSTGILFVCQREDIKRLQPADWIDPDFSTVLRHAKEAGVDIKALSCKVSLKGITLEEQIPVQI